MKFIKSNNNLKPLIDNVFVVVDKAKQAKLANKEIYDASIGSLADEEGKLVALNTVFECYNEVSNVDKARYAQSFSGNQTFKNSIDKWLFQDVDLGLDHFIIATMGGTGALSTTIFNVLEPNQTLIIPDIGWSSYSLMAQEFNIKVDEYQMFDHNNQFNLDSIKLAINKSIKQQNKAVIVINDPCHNPSGYSMSNAEWRDLIAFINSVAISNEVVLINDIAYIDYAYNPNKKKYFELFKQLHENVLVVLAYSCSKAFTFYGLRCGAAVVIHSNNELLGQLKNVYEKTARTLWSNIPNSPMLAVSDVLDNHYQEYLKEKDGYIKLLKSRSDLFIDQVNKYKVKCYPYKEGFFVTLRIDDNHLVDLIHQELMDLNVFTVKVNRGIRIGVCSLPINKISKTVEIIASVVNKYQL